MWLSRNNIQQMTFWGLRRVPKKVIFKQMKFVNFQIVIFTETACRDIDL